MSRKNVTIGLIAIFCIALFLMCFFNWSTGIAGETMGAGTDPWYHLRVVEYILENGRNLRWDPLLNFPSGWHNPRPIGFTFTAAFVAKLLGGAESSAIAALNILPAIFGALCIFPVYFIAEKRGKKEGILAALFLALTATHISTSAIGNADYDSFNLFFALLAIAFYVRAITSLKVQESATDEKVPDIRAILKEERSATIYAFISGIFLAILAMSWEGFVYVNLIMFLYLLIVQLIDHVRKKSSIRISLMTIIPFLTGVILSAPYYLTIARQDAWLISVVVLTAAIAASLIFTAFRKTPWILLFPGAVILLLAGLGALYLFVPEIAELIITGWGYFGGNPVYRTIAEAQPPEIGYLAFLLGPATFFLAFASLALLIREIWKKWDLYTLFLALWFVVATFMAASAARFVFNSGPIYAIMNGIFLSYILSFANFGGIRKDFGRLRRTGIFYALRRSIRIKHLLLAPLIAFVIFLPNALLAVDAGSSYEWEIENKNWYSDRFMGALGGGFMSEEELEGYRALANFAETYNEPSAIENRPAVASWWDYGFYNLQIGKHPTCADPFQNGYFWASRFFLSQNETHALQMIAARLLPVSRAQGVEFLSAIGIEEPEAAYESLINYEYTPYINEEQAIELLALIKESTGRSIEYVLTTAGEIGISSEGYINVAKSYRIVELSGFNESDFIHEWYGIYSSAGYPISFEREEWMEHYTNIRDPQIGSVAFLNQDEALRYVRENREKGYVTQRAMIPVTDKYANPIPMMPVTDKYVNSTLYKLCVGYPPVNEPGMDGYIRVYARAPAYGMKHFKTISDNGYTTVARYYPGAIVEGKIYGVDGSPLLNITVGIRDENGVTHDSMNTEGDGSFTLVAPEGDLKIAVTQNGGVIAESALNVSFEQAMDRDKIRKDIHLTVKELRGAIEGRAFLDNNINTIFDEGDTPAINGTVMLMRPEEFNRIAQSADQMELLRALTGATSAEIADGTFKFEGIDVGSYILLTTSGEYVGRSEIIVNAGEATTVELPMIYTPQASQMLPSSNI